MVGDDTDRDQPLWAASGPLALDPAELIESSPDGIVITDVNGTIVLVNNRAEVIFGYARRDLIGQKIELLVPDHQRGPHTAHRTRYRADPVSRPMGDGLELRARHRDGHDFPVEISLSPIGIGDDLRFFAAVRDVSERVAAEAENKAVHHVIDSAHDALYMFEPESLRLVYANRGLINQLGYDGDELKTMTPLHFMPDLSRVAFVSRLQPLFADEVESVQFTATHRCRQGTDVPVDVVINFPRPQRSDQARRVVALARDVSRRHRIERERADGSRWLEALASIRSSLLSEPTLQGAMTLIVDQVRLLVRADVVVVAEPAVASPGSSTLQAPPSTLTPRYCSASSDHQALVDELIRATLQPEAVVADVLRGATRVVERAKVGRLSGLWSEPMFQPFEQVLLVPMERNGTVHGLLLVGRTGSDPFTDSHVAMAASLADEGASAYTLVDARRAKVHLRLLEDRERLGRDLHDLIIQRIFAAGLRLHSALGLVDDPVVSGRIAEAISQLDETIIELRNTIFQLSTPVDLVVADRLQTVVDEAARHLPNRPGLIITGDPSRIPDSVLVELEPALTEMLANVWRHAQASLVEVTVQVGGDEVRVSVTDNGRGFDLAGTPHGNGLGNLGLRAERLGGTCRVVSSPNQGTTVHWNVALEPESDRPVT